MTLSGRLVVSTGLSRRSLTNLKCLEDANDLTPLTDATFVANTLGSFSPQQKQNGAGTGWRGIGRKLEVAVLQRDVAEAMKP